MVFHNNKPIYLQIADIICENIIVKTWQPEQKIPSVREYAGLVEVNQNTVLKTYNYLEQQQIIYKKRGIGYFVDPAGYDKIISLKKSDFMENQIPGFIKTMGQLNISLDDFISIYEKHT